MDYFSTELQGASLGGVPLPSLASRRQSGGRAYAVRRYPYRPGQEIEDTGREPRTFELEIPLFRSIDPEDFPTRYEQLIAVVEDSDGGGEVEYVDPFFGPIPVKVVSFEDTFSGENRDGTRLVLRLEEVSFEPSIFAIRSSVNPAGAAKIAASTLDAELAAAGVGSAEVAESWEKRGIPAAVPADGSAFRDLTDDFVEAIEAGALAADDLAAQVDGFRRQVDAVRELAAYADPDSYGVLRAVSRLIDTATLAAEAVAADAPRLVEYRLPGEASHVEIAAVLYGDPARSEEIVRRNPAPNPLAYPSGSILVVASR